MVASDTEKEVEIQHHEDISYEKQNEYLIHEARAATDNEHNMGIIEAVRLYPKAIAWSLIVSSAIIMEGYDTAMLNNFYGLPAFNEQFGTWDEASQAYSLSAPWQSGLSNGVMSGEIIGLFISGVIADKIGYRWTLLGALVGLTGFIFLLFFAETVQVFLLGQILCGLCWGMFQTLTISYATEVCPVVLRYQLSSYVNLCWVFGQLMEAGVLYAFQGATSDGKWAYKVPIALQWIWPIPVGLGIYLAPESPWYYIRRNKPEAARHSLERLTSKKNANFNLDATIAMMQHTNAIENDVKDGTSYLDLFKGVNLRRTEIISMAYATQVSVGSTLQSYSSYFYEQAGLTTDTAFKLSIIQYCCGVLGTTSSWYMSNKVWGRRTLYLFGTSILGLTMFLIGFLDLAPQGGTYSKGIGSLLIINTFLYDLTIGAGAYSVGSEMPSSRLRTKSIVVARNSYNIYAIVASILISYQINPTAWGWGAKCGFFWGGMSMISVVWVYFRFPDVKGRTFAEIDVLFETKVPAKKFKSTKIDPFELHRRVLAMPETTQGPF